MLFRSKGSATLPTTDILISFAKFIYPSQFQGGNGFSHDDALDIISSNEQDFKLLAEQYINFVFPECTIRSTSIATYPDGDNIIHEIVTNDAKKLSLYFNMVNPFKE